MKRALDCGCGHHMEAVDDSALFRLVREHVDNVHPELNYTREDIQDMISEKAYTVPRNTGSPAVGNDS